MAVRAPTLLLLVLLSGCQSGNPYTASHLPYPPPPRDPATALQVDPGSYPATPRDFAQYRTWQWAAAVGEPLAGIVGAELDQRGLRPATAQNPATLSVRAQQRSVTRQQQIYDDPYFDAGYGHYSHHHGYWGGTGYPLVRTISYRVDEVQLELFDARSGEHVWSGSGEAESGRARDDSLRRAVRQALSGFPPP